MKIKYIQLSFLFLLSSATTFLWLDNRELQQKNAKLELVFHEATKGWAECATKNLFVKFNISKKGGEVNER